MFIENSLAYLTILIIFMSILHTKNKLCYICSLTSKPFIREIKQKTLKLFNSQIKWYLRNSLPHGVINKS